jgi:hypothetical protein
MEDNVSYVNKEEMDRLTGKKGLLGFCFKNRQILIRKDLPEFMKSYVLNCLIAHEKNHIADTNDESQLEHEWEANWQGFKASPIGFFLCVLYTATSADRIRHYLGLLR